jgi:hypothetical protein
MITADKLALLTNMPAVMLTTGIQAAGYKTRTSSQRLFCYTVPTNGHARSMIQQQGFGLLTL